MRIFFKTLPLISGIFMSTFLWQCHSQNRAKDQDHEGDSWIPLAWDGKSDYLAATIALEDLEE